MKPSDFELANALTVKQAVGMCDALTAALEAMANYGSDEHAMSVVAMLHVVAVKEKHRALAAASPE